MPQDPANNNPGAPDKLPRGSLTRIANRLRPPVSVVHVHNVLVGRVTSARVSRAIASERRRIARAEARRVEREARERAAAESPALVSTTDGGEAA